MYCDVATYRYCFNYNDTANNFNYGLMNINLETDSLLSKLTLGLFKKPKQSFKRVDKIKTMKQMHAALDDVVHGILPSFDISTNNQLKFLMIMVQFDAKFFKYFNHLKLNATENLIFMKYIYTLPDTIISKITKYENCPKIIKRLEYRGHPLFDSPVPTLQRRMNGFVHKNNMYKYGHNEYKALTKKTQQQTHTPNGHALVANSRTAAKRCIQWYCEQLGYTPYWIGASFDDTGYLMPYSDKDLKNQLKFDDIDNTHIFCFSDTDLHVDMNLFMSSGRPIMITGSAPFYFGLDINHGQISMDPIDHKTTRTSVLGGGHYNDQIYNYTASDHYSCLSMSGQIVVYDVDYKVTPWDDRRFICLLTPHYSHMTNFEHYDTSEFLTLTKVKHIRYNQIYSSHQNDPIFFYIGIQRAERKFINIGNQFNSYQIPIELVNQAVTTTESTFEKVLNETYPLKEHNFAEVHHLTKLCPKIDTDNIDWIQLPDFNKRKKPEPRKDPLIETIKKVEENVQKHAKQVIESQKITKQNKENRKHPKIDNKSDAKKNDDNNNDNHTIAWKNPPPSALKDMKAKSQEIKKDMKKTAQLNKTDGRVERSKNKPIQLTVPKTNPIASTKLAGQKNASYDFSNNPLKQVSAVVNGANIQPINKTANNNPVNGVQTDVPIKRVFNTPNIETKDDDDTDGDIFDEQAEQLKKEYQQFVNAGEVLEHSDTNFFDSDTTEDNQSSAPKQPTVNKTKPPRKLKVADSSEEIFIKIVRPCNEQISTLPRLIVKPAPPKRVYTSTADPVQRVFTTPIKIPINDDQAGKKAIKSAIHSSRIPMPIDAQRAQYENPTYTFKEDNRYYNNYRLSIQHAVVPLTKDPLTIKTGIIGRVVAQIREGVVPALAPPELIKQGNMNKPMIEKYSREFVDIITAGTKCEPLNDLELVDLHIVNENIRDKFYSVDRVKKGNEIKINATSFVKKEAYQDNKDPRLITQMDHQYLLQMSRYTYPVKNQLLKKMDWYAPGLTGQELADMMNRKFKTTNRIVATDYSRFDGTESEFLRRNLEMAVYLKCYDQKYHAEIKALFNMDFNAKIENGRGDKKMKYYTRGSRLSGAALTTDGNTINNAGLLYVALRTMGYPPMFAYTVVTKALFYGDDAVLTLLFFHEENEFSIDIDQLVHAITGLGMVIKLELVPNVRIPFCSRFYDVINEGSIPDMKRALVKMMVSYTGDPRTPEQQVFDRIYGYYVNDPQHPIIKAYWDVIATGLLASNSVKLVTKLTGNQMMKVFMGAFPQGDLTRLLHDDEIHLGLGSYEWAVGRLLNGQLLF